MPNRFDYFVILAEMRTGSNFLEANLNAIPGLACHGELFNPHFVGTHNQFEFNGLDMEARAADPLRLLAAMHEADMLPGFRFFHDHDPRVFAHCLPDPRCAKIILTRNPIESYVSLKIARATGQWRLTNVTRQKQASAEFDAEEFERHLQDLQGFQRQIQHGLQRTGQTAFYIDYEDLNDLEVLNGLTQFLGVPGRLDSTSRNLKKQNPESITEKVINPDQMETALARLDRFNLARTPNFEPRRGPTVPNFRASQALPLLFMPIRSGPEESVLDWMAALDSARRDDLAGDFTQKTLTDWMQARPGHRAFTVLRHPLARAFTAFTETLLSAKFAGICKTLRRGYGLMLPEPDQRAGYGPAEQRADFLAFLKFLKGNLAGQSSVRVDPAWASQGAMLRGFAEFRVPDAVLRESRLGADLTALAAQFGQAAPVIKPPPVPAELAALYDDEIEAAGRTAYARDYLEFGFADWGKEAGLTGSVLGKLVEPRTV